MVRRVSADENSRCLPADLPWLSHQALVFRDTAVEALAGVLDGQGELLPLADAAGIPLFALNAHTIDALDRSRSKMKYIAGGRYLFSIETHVFRPRALAGVTVFRIPDYRTTYVTDEFVSRVRDTRLTGLSFVGLWEEATA
jgi:hypothetical protein